MSKEKETTQQDELLQEEVPATETEDQMSDESTGNESVEDNQLAKLQADNEELRNKFIRLMAEFDNFKKRTGKERIELLGQAARDTLSALLPVMDDFDRAMNLSEDQKTGPAFYEGMQLVHQKFTGVLKQRGLEPMETTGEAFDPEFHEALTEIPAPSEDLKGKIVDTIERGYTLNGKIIRHAKVVTGK